MTVIIRIIENKDLPKNKKKHDEMAKHVSTGKLRCEVNNRHRGNMVGTFTSLPKKVGCQRAGCVHKFLSVSSDERKSSCRSNLTRTLCPQIRSWPEVCAAHSKDRKVRNPNSTGQNIDYSSASWSCDDILYSVCFSDYYSPCAISYNYIFSI